MTRIEIVITIVIILIISAIGKFLGSIMYLEWSTWKLPKLFKKFRDVNPDFFEQLVDTDSSYLQAWEDYLKHKLVEINSNKLQMPTKVEMMDKHIDFVNGVKRVKKMGKFNVVIPEVGHEYVDFYFSKKII